MLHNVFDFADRPVREIMVPRPDVIFIEKGATLSEFFALHAQHPLSRYPVFEERRDNVVGILTIRDILLALANGTINNDSLIDTLSVRRASRRRANPSVSCCPRCETTISRWL